MRRDPVPPVSDDVPQMHGHGSFSGLSAQQRSDLLEYLKSL